MRFWGILLGLLLAAAAYSGEPIKACGGESNWPPMSYIQAPSVKVEGLSADILRNIFVDPQVELRPWLRCLFEVQEAHQDIVMSAFKTPERETQFLFSRAYHSLTPSYIYARSRFSKPPIHSLADLSRYKVCALHGSATFYTKLPKEAVESSANNYTALMKKLAAGYCDVVVDMREVFLGFAKLDLLPVNIKEFPIAALPETEKYPIHFAVSRRHPEGAALIDRIDQALNNMQRSGQLAALIAQYQK
ncbi:transporter substrate-binding domain-containing protein [Chitinibacter bivalviorum]|uniref:Transporter substrate-binding domain-containing protein n=1 Tax=Chitinibacter bivalviorum TaxID=2739434 RepID=A0A7H9BLJ3_9NEIS|nr:transporter substrate-binding domain-containing protein [Chitinibacter bivalviorum]QLG89463.1 transporter substrate-binding domain-containing protein [Chitinibacter bivalviorum]